MPATVLTVLIASSLALLQTDTRRIAGLLLVADLGFTLAGWAASLPAGDVAAGFGNVLRQLLGRSLAILVVLPCLTFLTSGLRPSRRLALLALLAYGGWAILDGPLTTGFAARKAALAPLLAGDHLWAALLCAGMLISCLAYCVMLGRAWTLPVKDNGRPAPRLALLILMGAVCISLWLSRNPAWLDSHIGALLPGVR